ncbi:leucine-rich repeat-containing protein 63 [Plakobranchus ocellatus]|uniref:Leucine-rich repeat-containing protein 63 n=1 Tax=Plakobranchus ocellatus TaxID=259542 RepID=A0AAV4D744_9GAST|nr:leucine-rich repeat-containing protein 63 [Plakobranchus ocellatus]
MAPGLGSVAVPVVAIPGLSSKKKLPQRHTLLRRPRAPRALPPLVRHGETGEEDTEEGDQSGSKRDRERNSLIKMFERSFDMDALQGVVAESDIPTDRGSMEPSLASPPPPSESDAVENIIERSRNSRHPVRVDVLHTFTSPGSGATFISRDDMKYVLDPLYRERTSLGTYVDGKSLVKPFKPRGPDPLPPRAPKQKPEFLISYDSDEARFYQPPAFMLEHFVYRLAEQRNLPVPRVRRAVYSKHNVRKLTDMLADELTAGGQENVHLLNMDPSDIPIKENRIPQRQLLYEMASMIKQHVREVMGTEVCSVIRPMPKFSPAYTAGSQPHTEIILYEDDSAARTSAATQEKQETEAPGRDAVMHSARSRYFQGSGRSRSPFAAPEDGTISPSELAILDSLIAGGTALSLKAHFISELPDVSPLLKTLTYLNLSFNNFTTFPLEVLNLSNLEVLKMRNNPMVEIAVDITRLQKLRVFIASFCLITALPLTLFELPCLEDLSVAYNRLTFLPVEISRLKSLQILDLEGNQIPALPAKCLDMMSLTHVNVRNNFMHPLFWKENTRNKPQHLFDLCCVAVCKAGLQDSSKLNAECTAALNRREQCDICEGPLFGPGLRIIRPVPILFNVKNMPLLFRACTPDCLHSFRKMGPETLRALLYGQ